MYRDIFTARRFDSVDLRKYISANKMSAIEEPKVTDFNHITGKCLAHVFQYDCARMRK